MSATESIPERFDPQTMTGTSMRSEHFARYYWIAPLVKHQRVLDAATGTGYGAAILANAGAKSVAACDIRRDVIDDARERYSNSGISFSTANIAELPYDDAAFDIITAFEIIEHLEDAKSALAELRRVLAPDGRLILSTPNSLTYPKGNPHHVREYSLREAVQLVRSLFPHTSVYEQHSWVASTITTSKGADSEEPWSLDAARVVGTEAIGQEAHLYSLIVASLEEQASSLAPVVALSVPIELRRWDEVWHEQQDVARKQARHIDDQAEQLTALQKEIESRQLTLEAKDQQLRQLEEAAVAEERLNAQLQLELRSLRAHLAQHEAELVKYLELKRLVDELTDLNHTLLTAADSAQMSRSFAEMYHVVVTSKSWRLTAPLRAIASLARRLRGVLARRASSG
ncbi:MAG TPA: methyltransferase domain-containing protein [Solirubrobacteraceae bacterium]|nr:methyltransferase domain-containing protein [Solirubrobacteraceae bacterium]